MEHEEKDYNAETGCIHPPKASADQSQYQVGTYTDDEKRRNKRGGILFIATVVALSLAVWLFSRVFPYINKLSILGIAVPVLVVSIVTIVIFAKVAPQKARKSHVEKWLFCAMFLWPVVVLLCNYIPTAAHDQLMYSLIYTGSPIFAAILAGIGGCHYSASRRFVKWLAAIILLVTIYVGGVLFLDSLQHGWAWMRGAAETPIFWLDVDLVVLSVLYLLVPERRWKQNRRSIAITLALLLAVSIGGYFLFLSGKGAVRLQTGWDMAQQIKMGNIPSENVPDFVLNGTNTYTIDFSGTVTIGDVRDTRTIYAETAFPGPTPKKMFVQLYLCQPLSSRTVKLADGTIAYGGQGYPQLVSGRSYLITGVLEKAWQVSPRVFVPSPANIREK